MVCFTTYGDGGVASTLNDLRKTELGQALTALEGAVDAGDAMRYNANGLFTSIGTTFTAPNGATVTRLEAPYLPVAAVRSADFQVCCVAGF